MTVEAFAQACRKVRDSANLTHEGLAQVFVFISGDDFWKQNALSPAGLLAKSKNGLRKIDNILARMKPATTKNDREKAVIKAWAEKS